MWTHKAEGDNSAKDASKAIKKGSHTKRKTKMWRSATFRRPKTQTVARKPLYARKGSRKVRTWDKFSIIKFPLTTESAMKTIEDNNTLTFIVDRRASKMQVKKAVQELYQLKISKINSLIRPDGNKKVFIRLSSDQEALEVASKIGIM